MTVPIVPGPFSFLAGAGQAVGAVGQAMQAREERKRQEAQEDFRLLMNLIATRPEQATELLNQPAAQRTLAAVGVLPAGTELPPAPGLPEIALPGGERMPATPGRPGRTLPYQFAETLPEMVSAEQARAIARGGAAGRAVSRVPSEAVAGAGERTTIAGAGEAESRAVTAGAQAGIAAPLAQAQLTVAQAGARAAGSGADASIARNNVMKAIFDGAQETLGTAPEFRQLAQEAALGILPLRVQRMSANLQYLDVAERRRAQEQIAVLTVQREIGDNYQQAIAAWERAKEAQAAQARNNATMTGHDPVEAEANARAAFTQQSPPPTFERSRDDYLRTMYNGMTATEFSAHARSVLTGGTGTPGTTTSSNNESDSTDLRQAAIARAVKLFRDTPTVQSVNFLRDAFNQGVYSSLDIQNIRTRVSRLANFPPALLAEIDAIARRSPMPPQSVR